MPEKLIFELGRRDREGVSVPQDELKTLNIEELLPKDFLRDKQPCLPEVSEIEVVRHYTRLSQLNFCVDTHFYPLGSCTMKYNPRIGEKLSSLSEFTNLHPYEPEELVQGALKIMFELGKYLCEIGGFDAITLQPSAGAHGELTGLLLIRAYHEYKGKKRSKVIIPDSAHGTNPASCTLAGYKAIEIKSGKDGCIDIDRLREELDEEVAAVMITNPNTLGIFEENILKIAELTHSVGALLYGDGANMNALMGISRPGDMGFDVLHFNLHKTFSAPHGGGGPGSGPVAVKRDLEPFLPVPVIVERDGKYHLDYNRPLSIGKVKSFYGNFPVMLKAYIYIRMMGSEGLKKASENAVLNARYIISKVKNDYDLPYDKPPMHEGVISGRKFKEYGIKTLDIAKRLLDYGFHPPTIYFPLIVEEALMIEPTETETKETLDAFINAMLNIANEAKNNPELLKNAPHKTPVRRLDEVKAARDLKLRWVENKGGL
ncbi:MAG: aminomethyl-transferring glycine dehydrogenase subunit GcvPB [Synergistetes bacterium]|nr:aminomethyl-transferring glycine dehydrogenase subunit GcvPB [Synergistota bacterium]MCX8127453.1 aminomethyl-transferring glycine dehydrogenase subunit GcvPB [Synergistota bacterium]MDW8192770.1 aminomethyl-transferring glycine dehydrogenase subunit GcvPB [Synergistota bacterium]